VQEGTFIKRGEILRKRQVIEEHEQRQNEEEKTSDVRMPDTHMEDGA
jgi:U4/U6 small nuclear ribonucleoprotein PRP3